MKRSHLYKLLIVAVLILAGIGLDLAGLLDAEKILTIARGYADHWWLSVILILSQVVLFTFALAGSLFLWVAAPLYPACYSRAHTRHWRNPGRYRRLLFFEAPHR